MVNGLSSNGANPEFYVGRRYEGEQMIELPNSSYLYALATISITYSGFAALAVIFRQTIGGVPSDLDTFFVRNVLIRSFMIAAFCLLPSLLAMFPLSHVAIWRISSTCAAVCQCCFLLIWWRLRHSITRAPLPALSKANVVFQFLAAAVLLMNAVGRPFGPDGGPFSAAVSAFMCSAGLAYMIALRTLLKGESRGAG